MLKSHLIRMSVDGPAIDSQETAAAMEARCVLTLAYLNRVNPSRADAEDGALDDAMFTAACRYVDTHKDRPDLTAETIARAIGCPRAGPYRMVDRRGPPVSAYVPPIRPTHHTDRRVSRIRVAIHL